MSDLRKNLELLIVMPVFNEEEALPIVVREWIPVLREQTSEFQILVVDDGSTDNTPRVLLELCQQYPGEVIRFRHPNQGHGQSCVRGYEMAAESEAQWVLQIDSDGQCDPAEFPKFWSVRERHPLIFGTRTRRDDGMARYLISYVVCAAVLLAGGRWIRDPNVPYRLMSVDLLTKAIGDFPRSFYLANIGIAARLTRLAKIYWIPIHFRKRHAGVPKVRLFQFARHGIRLFRQLHQLK